MCLHIFSCGQDPTSVTEADTQQAFVDILDNDVIKPLRTLKVKPWTSRSGWHLSSDNTAIRKESEDKTRNRIEGDLKESAAKYADHVEGKISDLEAYSKKNNPRKYSHSSEVSPRPQDGSNKRFGEKVSTLFRGRRDAEPAKSEEGTTDVTHESRLYYWIDPLD